MVIFLEGKEKGYPSDAEEDLRAEDVENTIKMVEEAYGTKVAPEKLLGGTRLSGDFTGGGKKNSGSKRSFRGPANDRLAALQAAAVEDLIRGESIDEALLAQESQEEAEDIPEKNRSGKTSGLPQETEEEEEPALLHRHFGYRSEGREIPPSEERAEAPEEEALTPRGMGANSPEVKRILDSLGVQAEPEPETEEKDGFDLAKEEVAAAAKQRAARSASRPVKRERGKEALKQQAANLKKNKKSLVAIGPILVLVLLLICMTFVQWNRPWQMTVNGQAVALVESKEAGQALVDRAMLEASAPYGADIVFSHKAEIDYSKKDVPIRAQLTKEEEAVAALKSLIQWRVQGYAIRVNDQDQTVYLPSEAAAQAVLDRVKEYYVPDYESTTLLQAVFVEPVEIVSEEIAIEELGTADAAFNFLVQGRESLRQYTVRSGDSLWSIAQQQGMTVEQLEELNPTINPNRLREGDVLALNQPQPILTVQMTVQSVADEIIPHETVIKTDEAAAAGSRQTEVEGVDGEKEIRYQIQLINGVELEREVLSETVVAEPVDEVLVFGSKRIQASRSREDAELYWPLQGKINSPFGARGAKEHEGLDIDGEEGDPVYSAEAGKVIRASEYKSYGKCVIIDHGGGLTTLYAHLNGISVKVGQQVEAQELIGVVGMTGRTTGAHLHFEVRVEDVPTNPLNYL